MIPIVATITTNHIVVAIISVASLAAVKFSLCRIHIIIQNTQKNIRFKLNILIGGKQLFDIKYACDYWLL